MLNKLSLFFAAVLACIFLSCENTKKEVAYTLNDVVFSLEAPIFSGSNTYQTEVPVDLSEVLIPTNTSKDKVKNIALEKIEISTQSPANFNNYENILVQFFGENVEMIEVASLSPISKEIATIKPVIIKDKDVKAYLQTGKLGIVLDANFLQDDSITYEIKTNLTFKISY